MTLLVIVSYLTVKNPTMWENEREGEKTDKANP